MKRNDTVLGIRAFAALVFACMLSATAQAEGVPAGTPIENTAVATYTIGGVQQSVPSNTVVVQVNEILDVALASLDGNNVNLSSDGAVLTFQITNTGNGPEAFTLDIDETVDGDDFDPAVMRIAYDNNGNGTYEDGVDTAIPLGGDTPEIAADGTLVVFIVTAIGTDAPGDGDTADVRLTANATTGSGTPGMVFTGEGVNGVNVVVGNTTARDDDLGTLIARLAEVTLVKSATILDPFGGTQAVPRAVVTYRLVASVTGSTSVNDLVIGDLIPANTTYNGGTLTLEDKLLTNSADGDEGEADATAVTVDLGDVAGGTSRTVTFQVTIEN